MMGLAERYLIGRYLLGCLPVLVALGGLFTFLALSEELEDVGKGVYSTADALWVTALTTPARLLELLPVVLLMGGILGLGELARNHEITALRAAGYSVLQLARPVVAVVLGGIVMVLGLRFMVIPDFELRAEHYRARTESVEFRRDPEGSGFWMRGEDQILHVEGLLHGRVLRRPEVYTLDSEGRVSRIIRADNGEIIGKQRWLLRGVTITDLTARPPTLGQRETLEWHSPVTESQTSSLAVPLGAMSPLGLWHASRALERQGLDNHRHRLLFWQQLSQPLGMLAMSILALPFLLGAQRANTLAAGAVLGGSVGILYYLGEQLLGHLSSLLSLSPLVAAVTPEVLILLLALGLIRRARGA